MFGQYLAKLLNQTHLQGLSATVDHSKMERTPLKRHQDHRRRVMASRSSHREEHLRQDSQCHVSVVQSRLQKRVLRPKSNSTRASKREAKVGARAMPRELADRVGFTASLPALHTPGLKQMCVTARASHKRPGRLRTNILRGKRPSRSHHFRCFCRP